MNKILATILETPVPKGITNSKIKSLIQEVAEIDTNPKLVYSARGEKILKELDEFGVKDIPQNYRGVLLEHWLELLSQNQENVTEIPEYQTTTTEVIRPTQPNSTTLTSDQLENLEGNLERVKKSDEIRRKQRNEVERGIKAKEQIAKQQKISTLQSSSKTRYEEIEREQTQIKKDIQEAQNVQKELEDKKIYAKITVPAIPELTQEEKQDLRMLEDFAKDPKTRTQLIEDFTQAIEERIKPTLHEATENEIKIIARTSAVDIVEKIANPEARQRSQEENIQTAVYQSLTTNPNIIKAVVKETKPLQALEKGSFVLAYYSNEQNATTQIIAGKLFDYKFKQIFYGSDYKEIDVEYIEKPIQGQTNYTVDIGAVNREFIGIQLKQSELLEKVQSLGIEKTQTYFSNQVGIYLKERVASLPAGNIVKDVYSNPILQTFLSKYGLSEPIVWQTVGQSRAVGVLMKIAPETAGPVLSIAGKALGIEVVKPVATKVAGQIASKAATQVAGKATGTSLGAAIGTITGLSGGPLAIVTAAIGAIVGEFISKVGSRFKVWWTKNKENIAPFLAAGVGLSLARFGFGPAILGGAGTFLIFGGTASALLLGPLRFFAILGRNIGITIATPVIVTLLILPPLVAFIMLVINNSAYIVPVSDTNRSKPPQIGVPLPGGGQVSSCKESEETGIEITEELASRIRNGSVKLLPETVWGRSDGICIKPTMIIMHWSGGTNDNTNGNQRTYETLIDRNLSCQIATDVDDNLLMERYFEKQVEFPACAGEWNTYSINNEMAGVSFTSSPPPPNAEELELAYDATCKIMQQYDIPWSQIYGHYHVPNSGKSDPGRDFLEKVFIPEIKRRCPNE